MSHLRLFGHDRRAGRDLVPHLGGRGQVQGHIPPAEEPQALEQAASALSRRRNVDLRRHISHRAANGVEFIQSGSECKVIKCR